MTKKKVMANTKIRANKSLIYQVVLLINPKAIVLIITFTIMFIKDQKNNSNKKTSVL